MTRFVWASLIAPLTAPLLYCVGSLAAAALDPMRRDSAGHNVAGGVAFVFAFGAPVAYAATLCLGLPALRLLRRYGPLTLWRAIMVGLVVGFGVAAVVEPSLVGAAVSVPLPPWSGGVLGSTAAAVWWRMAADDVPPNWRRV